jgi:hypothetical protein
MGKLYENITDYSKKKIIKKFLEIRRHIKQKYPQILSTRTESLISNIGKSATKKNTCASYVQNLTTQLLTRLED